MRCQECLEIVRGLEDLRWEAVPAHARTHLEECPKCRARFAALLLVEEGSGLRAEAPEGLASAVLSRRDALATAPQAGRQEASRHPVLRWAPFAAAAVLMIALGSFLAGYLAGGRGMSQQMVKVHLALEAPSAVQVAVVGDWNGWNPKAQPMKRQDGKWEIILDLERGRSYQYQFLVNGKEWIPDPNNLVKVNNGFGGKNSLIGS
jgi:Carbohydrate-binding module 48 (Isoamylase N-terminal domain)